MNLLTRLRSGRDVGVRGISTIDDYINLWNSFAYNGISYGLGFTSTNGIAQTLGGQTTEMAPNNFVGLATYAYQQNGPVFACMLVRQLVFSSIRFQWQRMRNGKPSDTYGTKDLRLLERPWPGGTTQDLLSRMINDADLAGNSYWYRDTSLARLGTAEPDSELVRLRPDWVDIIVEPRVIRGGMAEVGGGQLGWRKVGFVYTERNGGDDNPIAFLADEVVHFAPIPDPMASFRGMSWLTPILREIQADQAMTRHQRAFFDNGAPQPLDAKIMTPSGWSTMGQMRVGSEVIGSDGKPHKVLAVYPQGVQDIYRVTFTNGASTECTKNHLWSVASAYDRRLGVTRTMELAEIMAGGTHYPSGAAKWSVPLVAPIEFDSCGELPVDPYLLGSLIGDGCFRANGRGQRTSGSIHLAAHVDDAAEQHDLLAPLLPVGVQLIRRPEAGKWERLCFTRVNGSARANALTVGIKQLGLFDHLGYQKFVPQRYMRASVSARVALLQGLLDTDGSAERRQPNEIRFCNTSERLAGQVAELVNGLGGLGTVKKTRAALGNHKAQWSVRITRLPEWIEPFRLSRKLDIYRPTLRGGSYRYIQSIELVGRKPAQCISVDSYDHLYVTDDYVLTHNTVNLVITHPPGATEDKVKSWVQQMESQHAGAANAYKSLNLYPGADATPVGTNLSEIDFDNVRAGGEVRIAAAAGVPAVIVGLSKGLDSSTYSNYSQARRRFADGTAHPLWQNMAGSMQQLFKPPDAASRLWYDATDVPFLREDEKDAADIQGKRAATIASLIASGFTPDSAVKAVEANDFIGLLKHTGLTSVQLQKPGETDNKGSSSDDDSQSANGQGPQPTPPDEGDSDDGAS